MANILLEGYDLAVDFCSLRDAIMTYSGNIPEISIDASIKALESKLCKCVYFSKSSEKSDRKRSDFFILPCEICNGISSVRTSLAPVVNTETCM